MALSKRPAERHRQVAGAFTDRVLGARDWDAPAPVDGWRLRDVVGHLTSWFPAFLAAGAGVELPSGPSVQEDPVTAWRIQSDAVQRLLDDAGTSSRLRRARYRVLPGQPPTGLQR